MYYNISMYIMRNKFIPSLFYLGVFLCFILNIFCMYVKNTDISLKAGAATDVVSKFFKVVNFSNDIVSSMAKSKAASENKINNKNTQTKKNNILDAALTNVSINSSAYKNIKATIYGQFLTLKDSAVMWHLINYPLKIPFWRIIVFILLFRMLFNILPRSISIRKNIIYRQACTLS